MPEVISVNISEKRGTQKHEVPEIRLVANYGISGDAHAGDWHRQVSLLADESIDQMRKDHVSGLVSGAFAENMITRGIDVKNLPLKTKLRIGAALLEITQIGKECHNDCEIRRAAGRCVMPTDGVFARVLEGGLVKPGDSITIEQETAGGITQ